MPLNFLKVSGVDRKWFPGASRTYAARSRVFPRFLAFEKQSKSTEIVRLGAESLVPWLGYVANRKSGPLL